MFRSLQIFGAVTRIQIACDPSEECQGVGRFCMFVENRFLVVFCCDSYRSPGWKIAAEEGGLRRESERRIPPSRCFGSNRKQWCG
jgi:hypothetical protein